MIDNRNSTANQNSTDHTSFIERAGLVWHRRVFLSVFFICGALNFFGMAGFSWPSYRDKQDLLITIILIALAGIALDILWFSFFARCPSCRHRVFTFWLALKGEMPIAEIKNCPFCGFPRESDFLPTPNSDDASKTKRTSLLGKIVLVVLGGAVFGLFYIGIPDGTLRGFLAPVIAGVLFVLPFVLVTHRFGRQRGVRLLLLILFSSFVAASAFLLISGTIAVEVTSVAVFVIVFAVFFILTAMAETRSNIFK
jgi:hypothetical protein